MTYFLKIFKHHKPVPHYDLLPSTGQALMRIDGNDFVDDNYSDKRESESDDSSTGEETDVVEVQEEPASASAASSGIKLPAATQISGGKYFHFGLERGILCESLGVVFQHADVLQYVTVYKENKQLLPRSLKKKVSKVTIHIIIFSCKNKRLIQNTCLTKNTMYVLR